MKDFCPLSVRKRAPLFYFNNNEAWKLILNVIVFIIIKMSVKNFIIINDKPMEMSIFSAGKTGGNNRINKKEIPSKTVKLRGDLSFIYV